MAQILGQKPDTSPLVFRPPTLLFPPDRVMTPQAPTPVPWEELGPAIQDKYLSKARWLIKNSHVLNRGTDELAQSIYHKNPVMFEF